MPLNSSGDFVWLKSFSSMPYCYLEGVINTEKKYQDIVDSCMASLKACQSLEKDIVSFGFGVQDEPFDLLIIRSDLSFAIIWPNEVKINTSITKCFMTLGEILNKRVDVLNNIIIEIDPTVQIESKKISFQTSMTN